jgi:hypothetical protein
VERPSRRAKVDEDGSRGEVVGELGCSAHVPVVHCEIRCGIQADSPESLFRVVPLIVGGTGVPEHSFCEEVNVQVEHPFTGFGVVHPMAAEPQ